MKQIGTVLVFTLAFLAPGSASAQITHAFNGAAHDAGAVARDAGLAARESHAASEARTTAHSSHTQTPHTSSVHVPSSDTRWVEGYGTVANHAPKPVHVDASATRSNAAVSKNAEQMAKDLRAEVGKNSIKYQTNNKVGHIDLEGRPHGGVKTPHVQEASINRGPQGKINLSDKTVRPATKEDVRTARKIWERSQK